MHLLRKEIVEYFFRFAHPWIALGGLLIAIMIALMRLKFYRPIVYRYSLASALKKSEYSVSQVHYYFPFLLRFLSLLTLGLLIGRPQLVNVHSKIHVEGHDIMLVLDPSVSMQ